MGEEEKPIKIKIQNNNCLIFLKNNELTLLDKTKRNKKEDLLYEDDVKEMSYSVSNISENYSSKRKYALKKNNLSKDKIDFEISNISIFNSNLKQENSNIKTPFNERIKNEENSKNSSKKKEKNQEYFDGLQSKKLSIKKLKFDSAECDTIQETDTIKRLYSNKKMDENIEILNTENINKNLHEQFTSNYSPNINSTNKKIENVIKNSNKNDLNNNLTENKNNINNRNINNIKNELASTICYKIKCLEKYHNQLNKSKSKTLIFNNKLNIKFRNFSKEKNENKIILTNYEKDFSDKNNTKIKEIKISRNNSIKQIYNKNIIARHFSSIKKKEFLHKQFNSVNLNKILNNKIKSNNIFNLYKSPSFNFDDKNKRKYCRKKSLDSNKFKINKNSYNKFNLTNDNFKSKFVYSALSSKNIFVKKNVYVYNNYLTHLNSNNK